MVNILSLLFKAVLALGLGGLIGIDRERVHKGYPGGIRTLAFISLLGSLTSFMADATLNTMIYPVSIATIILLVSIAYGASIQKKSIGLTSSIVLLVTYFIGLISFFDDYQYLAISVAILTTLILTEKQTLHKFARKMESRELLDALKFGIVAFIILPLLPNQTIDPFNIINPYTLWLMVVLILGISFLGYIASKIVGASKGIYWSGALGGLVSSTAVTSSLSITSKKSKNLCTTCAVGITLASSIMFLRVLFECFIVNNTLGYALFVPLLSSTLIGMTYSFFVLRKNESTSTKDFINSSPFNFGPAIKFTIFLAIILIFSKITSDLIGEGGIYITSFLAGLVDTDAITLSMATLSGSSISYSIGETAILIACLTNTIIKLLLARSLGSKELFKKMRPSFLLMIIPLVLFILLTF